MNRRLLLKEGIACGALALGGGAFLFVRRSQARATVTSHMLDDALPSLTRNSLKELTTLPVRAREEIRRYFDGKCLNVEGFVTHICSEGFGERLGRSRTPEERENCFMEAFCSRVATQAEILNQVWTIAADVGNDLDSEWSAYCSELSGKWEARMQGYGGSLLANELTDQLSEMIRVELNQAVRQARFGHQKPAVGETLEKVGKSAVLLLPLVVFGPEALAVGIPVFVLLATKHVWDFAMARLEDRRGDYQAAISGRMALLGNRVGAEFEREVRLRLTDLHTWQEQSIREMANRLAQERIGLI